MNVAKFMIFGTRLAVLRCERQRRHRIGLTFFNVKVMPLTVWQLTHRNNTFK